MQFPKTSSFEKRKFDLWGEGDMAIVTVAFTDIACSSKLWVKNAHQMERSIAIHERQMHFLCRKYDGFIVKSIGDAYMVLFRGATSLERALEFAAELQRMLFLSNLFKIRIGIAKGPVFQKYTRIQGHRLLDIFGNTVNTASRMESKVCKPGGIVFTDLTSPATVLGGVRSHTIPFVKTRSLSRRSCRLLGCHNVHELHGVSPLIAHEITPRDLRSAAFASLRKTTTGTPKSPTATQRVSGTFGYGQKRAGGYPKGAPRSDP